MKIICCLLWTALIYLNINAITTASNNSYKTPDSLNLQFDWTPKLDNQTISLNVKNQGTIPVEIASYFSFVSDLMPQEGAQTAIQTLLKNAQFPHDDTCRLIILLLYQNNASTKPITIEGVGAFTTSNSGKRRGYG